MTTLTTTTFDGAPVAQDFSWSYSRVKNFETCPRRYHEIDVLKRSKEEPSQALDEGFKVHKALAQRITGEIPALPVNMPYEKWVEYACTGNGMVEAEARLAITSEFKPCGYFDKQKKVWLRTVADVIRIDGDFCHIIDWKTGKVKPDPEQLMLIGTCAMVHNPKIFNIKAELVWLGHDTKTTLECTVDDIAKFWPETMFEKIDRLRAAHSANDFPPKPSGLCKRWCPVTSCEYCGQ